MKRILLAAAIGIGMTLPTLGFAADPAPGEWGRKVDMPAPVHGVTGSAFVDGLIRITGGGLKTGGSSGSTLNQVYNPAARCQ